VHENDLTEALISADRLPAGTDDRRLLAMAVESVIADFIARWRHGATD
jgi:hypothetical protein